MNEYVIEWRNELRGFIHLTRIQCENTLEIKRILSGIKNVPTDSITVLNITETD